MMREACALLLLVLLCTGAALNVCTADRLVQTVERSLERAAYAADRGDFDTALQALDTARTLWDSHQAYTHVFLRHPDLDAIGDAFYQAEAMLRQHDREAFPALLAQLRFHLQAIDRMEHPDLGSIF